MFFRLYAPTRIYSVFSFLLTVYLVIKKKKSFLGIKPLAPKELKRAIIRLGASFVKLAQVLATRADFFDESYLAELKELHDNLPPMSQKEFDKVYKNAFINNLFSHFDTQAIASASIGQVHRATTLLGEDVAVKLRRLGIKEQVQADIKIISFFNKLFRPLFSHYTKNSIEAVISEFSKMILQEVSLNQERMNLEKFSTVYASEGIRFPKAYPEISCDDALVMSYEEGFRFDDKENLTRYKIDFESVISKLIHFYTTQMLINGYFHADPHPGNLLVNTKGELILLDFGMVKTVPHRSRLAIIELLKAANEQDYERYIGACKKLGMIAYEAPVSELAEFTAKMFAIFSNENLSSESMQELAFEVMESTRDLPFKLPSDAIYILRVSAIIEGLGTTYIENFNGIKDILPILQENIPRALGAKESLVETFVSEIKDLPLMAKDMKSSLHKIAADELRVELSNDQLEWIKKDLKETTRSLALSFMLLLSGFFILMYDRDLKEIALVVFGIGVTRFLMK